MGSSYVYCNSCECAVSLKEENRRESQEKCKAIEDNIDVDKEKQ